MPKIMPSFFAKKLLLALMTIGFLMGCANTIYWRTADRPAYLIDYGYHASLVLVDDNDQHWEYAYGEWDWFALEKNQWWRLPRVLLWPTTGTLGRQSYSSSKELHDHLRLYEVTVHPFEVEAEHTNQLLHDLDQLFNQYEDQIILNIQYGFEFVPLTQNSYHLFNNCNHVLIQWLNRLHLQTRGLNMFSKWDFRHRL